MRATHAIERTSLALPARGDMRIVVVADTHGRPHPSSARHIAALSPDLVLHAGDIGDLHVIDELATIAPVLAVRGNIDDHARETPDVRTIAIVDACKDSRELALILLVHIAVDGARLRADAARLARSENASLVVCGHSHVPLVARDREIAVFNPGSIGPRRFTLPIVFGVVELDRTRMSMHHVDCETGARWRPHASRGSQR